MDGLERLHQLRELVLDKNRIKALADNSFKSQNALLELHLSENRIQDFSHLEHLTELRKLFLDANKVQVALVLFQPVYAYKYIPIFSFFPISLILLYVSNKRVVLIHPTVYFWRWWPRSGFSAGFDLPAGLTDCCICTAMSDAGEEHTPFRLPRWYFPPRLQSKTWSIVIRSHYHPTRHARGSIKEIQVWLKVTAICMKKEVEQSGPCIISVPVCLSMSPRMLHFSCFPFKCFHTFNQDTP